MTDITTVAVTIFSSKKSLTIVFKFKYKYVYLGLRFRYFQGVCGDDCE